MRRRKVTLTYLTQAEVAFAVSQTRIYGVDATPFNPRPTTPDAAPLSGYLAGTHGDSHGRNWRTSFPLERK